jgi:Bacterial SH3 domain
MRKTIFILALLFVTHLSIAQSRVYFAAAKAGLSMREKPDVNAKVLEKINYAEKLQMLNDTFPAVEISAEGFNGFWQKVRHNNKTGYVVSSYLLPLVPPKTGVKNLKDYFAQVTAVAAPKFIVKKGSQNNIEEGGYTSSKQLYKNGMEWHEMQGYEYGADTYFIPDFSIEETFLLLRLLNAYPELIGEKDFYPSKNTSVKLEFGEKKIMVEREAYDNKPGPVKKIRMAMETGGYTDFEIFNLNGYAVVSWSSGV